MSYFPQYPQCKLDLILPRREFLIGESIPFEVKLDDPDSFLIVDMSIHLIQKTFNTKVSGKQSLLSGRQPPALKLRETIIAELINPVYWTSTFDGSWKDSLYIPGSLPPSTKSTVERYGSEQITDIQYVLQVRVDKGECLGHVSETFPIKIIVPPRLATNHNGNGSFEAECTGESHSVNSQGLCPNRIGYGNHLDLKSYNGSSNLGNKDCPPRYSMLSLPIVGASRSSSVETLPPLYQDTLHP